MSRKRRTEITIETERVVRLNVHNAPFVAWCDDCHAHIPTVTPKQAALLLQVSVAALQQLIQSHQLHLIEACDGLLLVCLPSMYHRN